MKKTILILMAVIFASCSNGDPRPVHPKRDVADTVKTDTVQLNKKVSL